MIRRIWWLITLMMTACNAKTTFASSVEGRWSVESFGRIGHAEKSIPFPVRFGGYGDLKDGNFFLFMDVYAIQSCAFHIDGDTLVAPTTGDQKLCTTTMDGGNVEPEQCVGVRKDLKSCRRLAAREQVFLENFFLWRRPLKWRIDRDRLVLDSTKDSTRVILVRRIAYNSGIDSPAD